MESIRNRPDIGNIVDELMNAVQYYPEQFSDAQIEGLTGSLGQLLHVRRRQRICIIGNLSETLKISIQKEMSSGERTD